MDVYQGFAPPIMWGPWIEFGGLMGGPVTFEIKMDTISNAESPFEAELVYYQDSDEITDTLIGPTTHRFKAGACVCVSKIRFKSYSMGQMIRLIVR